MRRVLRPALVCIAIGFLVEAWLWDRLEPIVAAIVELIPLKRLKAALAQPDHIIVELAEPLQLQQLLAADIKHKCCRAKRGRLGK